MSAGLIRGTASRSFPPFWRNRAKAVALAVRELAAPGADIIISESDGSNPGLKAANEAARAVGGRVAIPELDGRKCDFWDVWN